MLILHVKPTGYNRRGTCVRMLSQPERREIRRRRRAARAQYRCCRCTTYRCCCCDWGTPVLRDEDGAPGDEWKEGGECGPAEQPAGRRYSEQPGVAVGATEVASAEADTVLAAAENKEAGRELPALPPQLHPGLSVESVD